jgi:UDP-N-acetylglucosamine diphosphorylase / glucose-1-phosphate thymidylyltransferase / UDP-N-acetylgalactosamine diphosphorylase / glucosamine-1-phosphate N-acetyltransferase / galactosamine-1-phosphate N-acetyltransferase
VPISIAAYISSFASSPLAARGNTPPWILVAQSAVIVRDLLASLPFQEYVITEEIAVHRSAVVERGAVLKGPLILGPGCFVAASAYLRGGNWIDANCTFGPGAELKSSFVFQGTKLAHFNFVGDSVLGARVNLEAGSVICNYRNERENKEIQVRLGDSLCATGTDKFGALVGDDCRIGANAVVAPGALLLPGAIVARAELFDHERPARKSGVGGPR